VALWTEVISICHVEASRNEQKISSSFKPPSSASGRSMERPGYDTFFLIPFNYIVKIFRKETNHRCVEFLGQFFSYRKPHFALRVLNCGLLML
jgi:hypothetical protein